MSLIRRRKSPGWSKISSKIPSKVSSKVPSKVPSKVSSKVPSKVSSKVPEKVPEKVPSKISSKSFTYIQTKTIKEVKSYGEPDKILGEGSFGVVTLHTVNGKKYAVKKMKLIEDGTMISSSIREIAILQRMNHPNVIEIESYSISERFGDFDLKIATEYMDSGELSDYIRSEKFNPNTQSRSLVYQMLCGVAYMHSLDILHRDLKPQNILLNRAGKLKIADFGLSRALGCVDPAGKTVQVVTVWYRPPELLYGGRISQYGLSLDMWSVGCIIYEILTGVVLFSGYTDTKMRKLFPLLLGSPTEKVWPGVSKMPYYDPNIKIKAERERIKGYITLYGDKPKIKNKKVADEWFEIIMSLLTYDPQKRSTALETLKRPFFNSVRDLSREPTQHTCLENLYLVETPIKFITNPNLDRVMFFIVSNWLLGVKIRFRLKIRTYYIGLYLMDYLNSNFLDIDTKNYQLYGTVCLYLASTYNEIVISSPEPSDFVYAVDGAFDEDALLEMSSEILKQINFKMVFSTCYDFLIEYRSFYDRRVARLSSILMYYTTLLPESLYQTKPDQVALMAIMMACMYYGKKFKHCSKVSNEMIRNIKFCSVHKIKDEWLINANLDLKMKKKMYPLPKEETIQQIVKVLCSKKLIT